MQKFKGLSWPNQSLDLNLIEHMWTLIKRRLDEYPTPPKGMQELWECVVAFFQFITSKQCVKFFEGKLQRI
jgi:hypothetical protein